jgi:hypothetical protein
VQCIQTELAAAQCLLKQRQELVSDLRVQLQTARDEAREAAREAARGEARGVAPQAPLSPPAGVDTSAGADGAPCTPSNPACAADSAAVGPHVSERLQQLPRLGLAHGDAFIAAPRLGEHIRVRRRRRQRHWACACARRLESKRVRSGRHVGRAGTATGFG